MLATILHAPGDIRFEQHDAPVVGVPNAVAAFPLAQVADAYRAMDERRATKVMLVP